MSEAYFHIWASKDGDQPCTPTGKEWSDSQIENGRIYAQVRNPDGTESIVPKEERVEAGPGVTTALIDRAAVREFITTIATQAKAALNGAKNPGYLQMSRLHPSSEKLVPTRYRLDNVEPMIADAIAASEAGHNVYLEGRTVYAARSTGRGKLEDTAAVFALVIDSDGDTGKSWKPDGAVPSMTVETSPGNEQFWLFFKDALDPAVGKRLGERLRAATGADHDTGTITQPYRVAGTANYPNKTKQARGRVTVPTRILAFDPERLWTKEEIEEALPVPTKPDPNPDPAPGDPQSDESSIPADTLKVIRDGVPESLEPKNRDRSKAFFGVVYTLKARGFSLDNIKAVLDRHPSGIALKYIGRLHHEIERVYNKLDPPPPGPDLPNKSTGWSFHSTAEPEVTPWLIKGLLPETGAGLISGQWGTFKSTIALTLALSAMTEEPFAGRFRVKRRGGVVYFAPEGNAGLSSRLTAIARENGCHNKLPFAHRADCPEILAPDAVTQMTAMIKEAAAGLKSQFGVDTVLAFVDTVVATAGYKKPGDENDAALGQKIMATFSAVSRETGAFVIGLDHFGKEIETGTRGTSAKESHADVVLALIGKKELSGAITDTCLAIRKQREGEAGMKLPFTPVVREVGRDEDGDPITRVIIEWPKAGVAPVGAPSQKDKPDPWSKKSLRLLRQALMNVLIDHGKMMKPWPEGSTVRAVDIEIARTQFYRSYPAAEATDSKTKQGARQRAFHRAVTDAKGDNLIGSWEIEGITHIWLVDPTPQSAPGENLATASIPPDRAGHADRSNSSVDIP